MGERRLFHSFFRDKKSGVIWCTKSTMERQCQQKMSPIVGIPWSVEKRLGLHHCTIGEKALATLFLTRFPGFRVNYVS